MARETRMFKSSIIDARQIKRIAFLCYAIHENVNLFRESISPNTPTAFLFIWPFRVRITNHPHLALLRKRPIIKPNTGIEKGDMKILGKSNVDFSQPKFAVANEEISTIRQATLEATFKMLKLRFIGLLQ